MICRYHGTLKERESLRDRLHQSLPGRPKRLPLDVVLTTMSYFQKEKSDDRSFLRKFDFDYMIVDEGHCLKNPRGKMYRNMDKFKTLHRLLLTGKILCDLFISVDACYFISLPSLSIF